MKNDVFMAHLAQGAAVSVIASCLMPQNYTVSTAAPITGHELAFNDQATMPDEGTQQGAEETVVMTIAQTPAEWDSKMEMEFRRMALEEVKGTLSGPQVARLEELERWRNRLLNPQSSEDILLQIKRDRILERMELLLREYVQFQEATDQKRTAA